MEAKAKGGGGGGGGNTEEEALERTPYILNDVPENQVFHNILKIAAVPSCVLLICMKKSCYDNIERDQEQEPLLESRQT